MKLKLCRVRMKLFVIIMFFMTIYLLVFYNVLGNYLRNNRDKLLPSVELSYVVVHLDFKGSPPKLAYLEGILPLLRKLGVNGLLMEYEDMFPYEGKLVNLSARNAYTKDELKKFVTVAAKSGFEIIPLVQTFGHLEYALKLADFQNLREDPIVPDSICPSVRESREFLSDMLSQVILFHKNILYPLRYIHIGLDEVFNVNQCELCQRRTITKYQMFNIHFKFITKVVNILSPYTEILFWDDMLRQIKPKDFLELNWGNSTSPVYWSYSGGNYNDIHHTLYKYQQSFSDIWVATAFKGADGPEQTLPVLRNRFSNHWKWMEFMLENGNIANRYSFKGIILTGWSRYAHMDPPCELLPASIPSLILNLIVIKKYMKGEIVGRIHDEMMFIKDYVQADFNMALKCYSAYELFEFDARVCDYDGAGLYNILKTLSWYKDRYQEQVVSGYNIGPQTQLVKVEDIKLGYHNMNYLRRLKDWCNATLERLSTVEIELADALSRYFDEYVVNEYMFYQVRSLKNKFKDLNDFLEESYKIKVWSRGPKNITIGQKTILYPPV